MSASKEKKTRQEQAVSNWADPKTAREAQQRKEQKRSDILYATIAILFVLVAIVSLTWKSGIVQRKATAATMNGENYSAAEVQYYYMNAYQSFVSQYYNYLSYIGLDTKKSLKSQECNMGSDAGTWYDYFMGQALDKMSSIHALCDAADANGLTWNDSMQSDYQDSLDSLQSAVDTYNSSHSTKYSVKQYIRMIYGTLMTQSVYEDQMKLSIQAQAYTDQYVGSLTYTTDQLTAAYEKDPNTYDVVDYKSVKIDGAPASKKDSDGNAVDPTEEEKTAAMESAKKLANSIYANYQKGKNLSDLADANDTATYSDGVGGTYADSVLMKWLFDSSRKAGDSTVLDDESNSTYYVVVFGSRYRHEYNTVNVRHILIKVDTSNLDSSSSTYQTDLQARKDDAKKKAEDLLSQWKSGAATEDSFATLANKNSEDSGSNTNGGLYQQVYQGEMVKEFNNWCFDASRKTGDTGIVYGESDSYSGYHVIYFVGKDLPYWQVEVTNNLKNAAYNTWYTNLTKDYTATQHSFGIRFVG